MKLLDIIKGLNIEPHNPCSEYIKRGFRPALLGMRDKDVVSVICPHSSDHFFVTMLDNRTIEEIPLKRLKGPPYFGLFLWVKLVDNKDAVVIVVDLHTGNHPCFEVYR